jgi:hypothetical protein
MLAETAASPVWRFCLVIVKFIDWWLLGAESGVSSTGLRYYLSSL